jgi:hypothetical protein
MSTRSLPRALAAAAALLAVPSALAAAPGTARAEGRVIASLASRVSEGSWLVARADVRVAGAELTKGTRVRVTRVVRHEGAPTHVDLALCDGAVARDLTIERALAYFRVGG